MSVTVLVGGQYGSEGKGKVAAYLAPEFQHAVRTGGPNAGHTVVQRGRNFVLRHLPCAVVNDQTQLYLGAGSIIDVDLLLSEIHDHVIALGRLWIDPTAVLISDEDRASEASLVASIGSTGKGVGAAVAAKVLRGKDVRLARDAAALAPFVSVVADRLNEALSAGDRILLEGTQGTGLSLHHGTYPFVTSRDITAGSLCGEAGIGPTRVAEVILVVRTYPIRVAGPSGPLRQETTWRDVTIASGYSQLLIERTTVTNKVRRVGEFDLAAVVRAVNLNGATSIALTFADYLDSSIRGTRHALPPKIETFVKVIEKATNIPVKLVSTGPDTDDMIVRDSVQ